MTTRLICKIIMKNIDLAVRRVLYSPVYDHRDTRHDPEDLAWTGPVYGHRPGRSLRRYPRFCPAPSGEPAGRGAGPGRRDAPRGRPAAARLLAVLQRPRPLPFSLLPPDPAALGRNQGANARGTGGRTAFRRSPGDGSHLCLRTGGPASRSTA